MTRRYGEGTRWLCALGLWAACAAGCEGGTDAAPVERQPAADDRPSATLTVDQAALQQLPARSREAVAAARLPVLVVDDARLLAAAVVMSEPRWTAVSSRSDGITVSLHATAVRHRFEHIAPHAGRSEVRGTPAWVTQNEGIWSAAWTEGGVAYSLELECDTLPDPRCDDSALLLELATKLVVVGGRVAVPEVRQ